ncbi:hypothetical protein [Streptomyces sp. NPDC050263]|uniref:hypothetical protein n=1 Tax=Streptomyces sp. NPDC050263 TaxID=3155037 RepID=UPI0034154A3B
MDDNSDRRRPVWPARPLRVVASAATVTVLLGGCGTGGEKADEPSPSASASASGPSSGSGSPAASASASSSTGSGSTSLTPFEADPAAVPRTKPQAEALAKAVALRPEGWGAGFRAQQPAESAPGTVAVLDEQCRWQRQALPQGVLASLSLYSVLPAVKGKGELKVTAAVTVHSTVLDADEQLATTLEEALRCPVQQVRTDEQIAKLQSIGTPYGQGGNGYADDQVLEMGSYLSPDGAQTYRWDVLRLGTVTVAVSVKGAAGYSVDELTQYMSNGVTAMLSRVQYELGGKS